MTREWVVNFIWRVLSMVSMIFCRDGVRYGDRWGSAMLDTMELDVAATIRNKGEKASFMADRLKKKRNKPKRYVA